MSDVNIQTLAWEINVASMQQAKAWQDKASMFTREKLPAILESLFQNSDDMVIERMELDIGTITSTIELEEKIIQHINEYRAASRLAPSSNTADAGVEAWTNKHWLTRLEYYLYHGTLQFTGDRPIMTDTHALLLRLEKIETAKRHAWFKEILSNHDASIRLLDLFSSASINILLRMMTSSSSIADEAISFFEWLMRETNTSNKRLHLITVLSKTLLSQSSVDIETCITHTTARLAAMNFFTEKMKEHFLAIGGDSFQFQPVIPGRNNQGIESESSRYPRKYRKLLECVMAELKSPTAIPYPSDQAESNERQLPTPGSTIQDKFFVDNAGIILLYPYLKRLFVDKGWLKENGEFNNETDQLTACYWLQFLATADPDVQEYDLVLIKILCGFTTGKAVSREWHKENGSLEEVNEVLVNVINNWEKIGTVSPAGFRGSFLLRQGILVEEEHNWLLHVERKAWDMLIDTLPYPLGIIKLPWMTKPLYVQW